MRDVVITCCILSFPLQHLTNALLQMEAAKKQKMAQAAAARSGNSSAAKIAKTIPYSAAAKAKGKGKPNLPGKPDHAKMEGVKKAKVCTFRTKQGHWANKCFTRKNEMRAAKAAAENAGPLNAAGNTCRTDEQKAQGYMLMADFEALLGPPEYGGGRNRVVPQAFSPLVKDNGYKHPSIYPSLSLTSKEKSHSPTSHQWMFDPGASYHITWDKSMLIKVWFSNVNGFQVANGLFERAFLMGDTILRPSINGQVNELLLKDVLHVLNAPTNIRSTRKFCADFGMIMNFQN